MGLKTWGYCCKSPCFIPLWRHSFGSQSGIRDVTHPPPRDRDAAMAFQDHALRPALSNADNNDPGTTLLSSYP
jgi:hypothetical protein